MNFIFAYCSSLKNINVFDYVINGVKNIEGMFFSYSSLEKLDFKRFNTSETTKMTGLFCKCKKLKELNISILILIKYQI